MRLLSILAFILLSNFLTAQYITGIGTIWADDFREWVFLQENDDVGELRMRWRNQRDWREWDFRIGELTGTIEQKWKDNPNQWEVRSNNEIATIRTNVNNNFREWRVTNNKKQLNIRTRFGNIADEWQIRSSSSGNFEVLTVWENDPREWVIIDELNEDIPFTMKVAMIFAVLYSSVPK